MINHSQPAARGRLGAELNARLGDEVFAGVKQRHACRVDASLAEDGTLTLSGNGRVNYGEDGWVGATIEQAELPAKVVAAVKKALEAALDDAHDDLRDEADREAELAFRQGATRRRVGEGA